METNKFNVDVDLVGKDGNAFMVLGICQKAARRAGIEDTEINKFLDEAKQGDYDHLLRTCMKYFNVN
jgi:hypothetical protein|tara:strand:+ start:232 stop:432 length:201 start_codon:yes stop_codon:yes gene_type:complete